jgi:hypothetical protein
LQYKMRWIEHSSNRKWYSSKNFEHAKEIETDYHDRYSNKSKSHSIIMSLIIHRVMNANWISQKIKNAKKLIQKILNKMKKEMKSNETSIFSIDRNIINTKTANQRSFVTKTICHGPVSTT